MADRNIEKRPERRRGGWSSLLRRAGDRLGRTGAARRRGERPAEPAAEEGWQAEVLQDPVLQKQFEKNGYARLPALGPSVVSALLAAAHRLLPPEVSAPEAAGSPYHCSFMHSDQERRREVQAVFAEAFAPYVKQHLKGYRVLHAAIHVKPPGGGRLPLHINWSSVADLNRSTITLWCPLVDVGLENGTLELIPGSHRITRAIEAEGRTYFHKYRKLLSDRTVPQPARAGEVILIEDTILHGSQTNQSDRPRIAAQIVCIPEDAVPVYYSSVSPTLFEVIKVDSDFFVNFDHSALKVRQEDWTSLGFVRKPVDPVDLAEFDRRVRNPSEVRRSDFRLEPAPAPSGGL
jgi:hypothetical protein